MRIVCVPGHRRLRLKQGKRVRWIDGTENEGEKAAAVVLPVLLRWMGWSRRKARAAAPGLVTAFCVEFFYARGRGVRWEITGEECKRWLMDGALE